MPLTLKHKGRHRLPCRASFEKGAEMGHFRQGSTIILFGTEGLELCDTVRQDSRIRMGEPLMRHRREAPSSN
jgi:phosphatidylserine decarboxylase